MELALLLSSPQPLVRSKAIVWSTTRSAALGLACLLYSLNAGAADCASSPAGLVAWWQGEGNVNDIAGTNNGTPLYGTTFAPGKVGWAFSFDGINDLIEVQSSPAVSFASNAPMSVELWANRTGSAPIMHLLGKRICCITNAGQINYQMYFSPGGGVAFGPGDGQHDAATRADMPTNTWTHIVATSDGSNIRIYTNGFLAGTATGNLGPPNTFPLTIGGSAIYERFNGLIDEVSLYDRALSSTEIAALFAAGSSGKCIRATITHQPASQIGFWEKSVYFNVQAAGSQPLTYQWLKNGAAISSATDSSLTLSKLQVTSAGTYSVLVTNSYGSTTSSNAYLTINPAGVSLGLYSGITIDGVVGLTYGVQCSTNLSDTNGWRGLANITLSIPTQLWFDVQSGGQPQRYYRIVPGPISIP